MKTKTIPFDLEMAKKIQAGEMYGKIKTREGHPARLLCTDLKYKHPIIAAELAYDGSESVASYTLGGILTEDGEQRGFDLVFEVPDNEQKFKPYDRVLVRDSDTEQWRADFFSHMKNGWHVCTGTICQYCIPYEGHEHLIGTTDKPKEE